MTDMADNQTSSTFYNVCGKTSNGKSKNFVFPFEIGSRVFSLKEGTAIDAAKNALNTLHTGKMIRRTHKKCEVIIERNKGKDRNVFTILSSTYTV